MADHVELVVCAAPLAGQAHRIAGALRDDGYSISVVTSLSGATWIDQAAVESVTGTPPATALRGLDEPRSRTRPTAVICVPGTFNTLNKLRAGINDTPALGSLNDAVGSALPTLVVPAISERLVHHPAWVATHGWLIECCVTLLDPVTGKLDYFDASVSGDGDSVAQAFQPAWLTSWLRTQL